MLLRQTELDSILTGNITLVFRRWRKPTLKTGSTLMTSVGVLAIESVEMVERAAIHPRDARKAGYDSLAELLDRIDAHEGDIYRIKVRVAGADPRLQLREHDQLSSVELDAVRTRLARLDAASRQGEWTRTVLQAIDQNPRAAAALLATLTGFEKDWLKTNVRKLKNMGLTISHHPGYELSSRGKAVLRELLFHYKTV